ncbi:MAG: PH domain-containing protein [Phycisphaerae bacterium]|nr:PH domain-containing protein [Phycisphaerae bacterium]
MADQKPQHEFEIDREAVYRYTLIFTSLLIGVCGIFAFGVGLLLGPLWFLTLGRWVHRRQANALRYWLDGSTLRINKGFIFLQRKSIPLDRVTDFVFAQGPLARACGVWIIKVQTAGTGQQMPEGTLVGVVDAEAMRDLLLTKRDDVAQGNRSGA